MLKKSATIESIGSSTRIEGVKLSDGQVEILLSNINKTSFKNRDEEMTIKKIHFALLIILSSVFFSAGAIAQNKPLACQSDVSAGLSWENGRWVTSTFNGSKFILVQTKDGLTGESVERL